MAVNKTNYDYKIKPLTEVAMFSVGALDPSQINQVDPPLKRIMDVGLGWIGTLFALPIILIISLILWIASIRPPFYEQERVGRNGRLFKMLKFATMSTNETDGLRDHLQNHPAARREWEQTHKLRDDPRITKIGRLLRRTSLDELPQLVNVLKGEMSLVGPRPILVQEMDQYGDRLNLYLTVRPGLTGLWQVSGRNERTFAERIELDEHYIRRWSIWLDISILFRTIWAVLACDGAY